MLWDLGVWLDHPIVRSQSTARVLYCQIQGYWKIPCLWNHSLWQVCCSVRSQFMLISPDFELSVHCKIPLHSDFGLRKPIVCILWSWFDGVSFYQAHWDVLVNSSEYWQTLQEASYISLLKTACTKPMNYNKSKVGSWNFIIKQLPKCPSTCMLTRRLFRSIHYKYSRFTNVCLTILIL